MKSSAIALLLASTSAMSLKQLEFLKTQGDHFPRFCEMGASATDNGEQGCIPTPKYPVPVKPVLEKPAPAKKADSEVAPPAKPAPSKAKPAGLA